MDNSNIGYYFACAFVGVLYLIVMLISIFCFSGEKHDGKDHNDL